MSNDVREEAAAYSAKVTEEHEVKRQAFRTRMGEKAPDLLKALDYMKALYGPDLRLGGMVLADEVIGKPYPPEEIEAIQARIESERANPEPEPAPAPVQRKQGYRGKAA